jgi:hypothetical protein
VALLEAQDVAGFMALVEQREYECPADLQPLVGPWPLCVDAPAGERRVGIVSGRLQSEAGVLEVDAVEARLNEWIAGDGGSDPDVQISTVGCPITGVGPVCDGRYFIIMRRLAPPGMFDLLALVINPQDGRRIAKVSDGIADLNSALVTGGRYEWTIDVDPTDLSRPRLPTFYFAVSRE